MRWPTALLIAVTALATAAGLAQRGGRSDRGQRVQPGQPCPAGMTEVRPGDCQPPELPPPSIVDYRPKSTVVADDHPVPRAKYPLVDIHNHQNVNAENVERLIKEMDELNMRVMVNLSGGSGDRLMQNLEFIKNSPHKDRFRLFANVAFNGVGTPGWSEKAAADLEAGIRAGAIGLKIFKPLGLQHRKADGSRLKIDDPELDALWQVCARMNVPVLIHTADPAQFFEPIDFTNERWLELALFPGRQYPADKFPSFETLAGERDRMFARNPAGMATTSRAPRACWTRCPTCISKSAPCCTSSAGSLAPRESSSPGTRIACCSARMRISRASIRITSACSRRATSISTTTGTTTHRGSCTAWACQTSC